MPQEWLGFRKEALKPLGCLQNGDMRMDLSTELQMTLGAHLPCKNFVILLNINENSNKELITGNGKKERDIF